MSAQRVAIVCHDCETRREVGISEIAATLVEHNNLHHNGDEIAEIAGGGVDWSGGDRL